MASERYQILTKVIEVLKTIKKSGGYNTDVKYVSDNLNIKHPEELDKNRFPALFPIDADEEKESMALHGGPGDDMLSVLTIIVTGMVYARDGNTMQARSDLIHDVEKAIVNDAALTALLLEAPSPTRVVTDKGFFQSYSVFDLELEVRYCYDHETGG